jgi:hypothetical protein
MFWMARRKSATYVQPYVHSKVGPAEIKMLAHCDLIGHSMTNSVPGYRPAAILAAIVFLGFTPEGIFCTPFPFYFFY